MFLANTEIPCEKEAVFCYLFGGFEEREKEGIEFKTERV